MGRLAKHGALRPGQASINMDLARKDLEDLAGRSASTGMDWVVRAIAVEPMRDSAKVCSTWCVATRAMDNNWLGTWSGERLR